MATTMKQATTLLVVIVAVTTLHAQRDTVAIPRLADGKPDMQGIWKHGALPATGTLPYLPAALAKQRENYTQRATADPLAQCFLAGVPRIMLLDYPFQIFQMRNAVAMTFEWQHVFRLIYTNGTKASTPLPFWMGDSRGRWDGDTLVVDVSNFNGRTWLDMAGKFVDENEHVVERFTLVDTGTILYEATVTDPTVFVKPIQMRFTLKRVPPEQQILEYSCLEGERSLQHYTDEDGGTKRRVK